MAQPLREIGPYAYGHWSRSLGSMVQAKC